MAAQTSDRGGFVTLYLPREVVKKFFGASLIEQGFEIRLAAQRAITDIAGPKNPGHERKAEVSADAFHEPEAPPLDPKELSIDLLDLGRDA